MLPVANHEHPLAEPLLHREIESAHSGGGRDERHRFVVVLARGNRGLPFAEVKCSVAAVLPDREFPERGARVALRQFGNQPCVGWPLPLPGERSLVVCPAASTFPNASGLPSNSTSSRRRIRGRNSIPPLSAAALSFAGRDRGPTPGLRIPDDVTLQSFAKYFAYPPSMDQLASVR